MSRVFKLSDLIETKYMYETIARDLEYIIEKSIAALQTGEIAHMLNTEQEEFLKETIASKQIPTIDVCDVKLTDGAAHTITVLQTNSHVKFIDSKNEGRNNVLAYNTEWAIQSHSPAIPLPLMDPAVSIIDYAKSLDYNSTYELPVQSSDSTEESVLVMYAIATKLLDAIPMFKLSLTNSTGIAYLEWVHKLLTYNLCGEFTEFYAIDSHNKIKAVDTVKYDIFTSKIETREKLHTSFPTAWNGLSLVPTELGNAGALTKYPKVFGELSKTVDAILINFYNNRPRDLFDILDQFIVED